MSTALVFPGQAAEEPGMGLALAAVDPRAKRLIALASEAAGIDLARAIERGGRALGRTDVLQPALLAVSLGAAHALARHTSITTVLGHSLGELAAACFALDVDDVTAVALAADRGRRMAEAAQACPGGMIAVPTSAGLPAGLSLAGHNADDEHVYSGDDDAITHALRVVRGATRLRVSGPWHSLAMEPVVAPFREHLVRVLANRTPRATLLSAVSARVLAPSEIVSALAQGVVAPVQWVDTLRALPGLGITRLVMAPPGRVSRALVRRTLGTSIEVRMLESPRDLGEPWT